MSATTATPARSLAWQPLTADALPHLSEAAAAVHRRLLRSAHPALHFAPVAPRARGPGWWLQLRVGSLPLVLQAPASSWPEWSPAQTGGEMPDALRAAGIAQAAMPLWAAFTQVVGAPVQLVSARWLRDAPAAAADALGWRLDHGGGCSGSLQAPTPPAWTLWAAALQEPTPSGRAAPPPALGPDRYGGAVSAALTLPVTIEVGHTRLPAADLARLRCHAVLLIDTAARPSRAGGPLAVRVLAGTGRLPLARALWHSGGGLHRQPGWPTAMDLSPPQLEGNTMSAQAERSSAPQSPALDEAGAPALDLGPLEVDVRFELARQPWTLSELAQWKVGEALAFDMPLSQAMALAWIHDRCVASGRLVVVGDRLGLRIDALHAAPPAAAAAAADCSESARPDGSPPSRS
jgi:type III secretion system YscQ/HrcQ family protein